MTTTEIQWRNAGPEDAAILSEIGTRTFVETFGHLYSPEDLAAFLAVHSPESWRGELSDPRFAVRLGEIGGQAIAYAKIGPHELPGEAEGPAVDLKQIYVLGDWHGTSVARELMDWVLAEARARGAGEVFLSVFTENPRAIRFYERYGFEPAGRYAFMVGDQADEDQIMRLRLREHRL